jgi:hypothetical protein
VSVPDLERAEVQKYLPCLKSRQAMRVMEEVVGSPEQLDREAHNRRAQDSPESPDNGNSDHDVTHPAKVLLGEDAQILHQNGELGEPKRCVIRPKSAPEEDGHLHYVDGGVPDVQAHALHRLVVGRDAVHQREDRGHTNETVVKTSLFRDESSCADASNDNQAHKKSEDYTDCVDCALRSVSRHGRDVLHSLRDLHGGCW